MSAKIALLGATGLAGRRILEEALTQGYRVRAYVRDVARVHLTHAHLEVMTGDATNAAAIQRLIDGCQAVLSAVGPADKAAARAMVCSTATQNVIAAMKTTGVKRYVVLSGASVKLPSDRRDLRGQIPAVLGPLVLGAVFTDKQREYDLLNASGLDWTLVRCPAIKEGAGTGDVQVNLQTVAGLTVYTQPLARFMLWQVTNSQHVGKGLFVGNS